MSSAPISLPVARRRGTRAQFVAAHGGMAAAAAVWLIARFGLGLQVRTPGFAPGQHAQNLSILLVLIAGAVAGAAAWAAVKLIERTASRPRRAWVAAGLLVTLVSLSAPLAGHGITVSSRLTLVCMHLAVAAVLIPAFLLTIRPRQAAASAPAVPDYAPLAVGHRRAS
jgi:Family of unknown function (DUF6069)